jgi:hypothetical protein
MRSAGQANPLFRLTYKGFIVSDNLTSINVKPTASCSANLQSPAGFYDITISGGEDENYDFIYVNGLLTVTPSTGLNEVILADLKISPNPSNGFITITGYFNKQSIIKVYDIVGNIRLTKQLSDGVLDVSMLSSGVYILKIDNIAFRLLKK